MCQRPPDLVGSAAEIRRERFLQGEERFGAPAQAPYGNNGHPAFTGLRCRLHGEPRFADTGLAQNQDGMPLAGTGHPGDVLAQQIKLKLPVDQRFLRAAAACFGRFAAVTIPRGHSKLPSAWGCRPRAQRVRGHDLDFRDKCLPLAPAQAQRITPRLGCPGRTLATFPWQKRGSVPLDAWSHGRPGRWAGRLPPRSCRRFRCYRCSCATWHRLGPRPWRTSLVLRQVFGAAS
jgi:hypothetical protein